ncbi:hypothetical protein PCCS19_03790 [Paenibacillus sp. CCS19]|uniref:DoxX family protein n=1 Tax=Paenibacillus sp. CCS19 TaxID=3158387 RepID=UPI00256C455C|nr:DoxX family protein [Paenibacillus cellulosilyticus]GMK37326.1 hypothetical protein PCCS19_03790 [Paenibacillus cellulosilyticus]
MNIALWIAQGLMALAFIMAGMMKSLNYEKARSSLPWVKEYSKGFVNFIGIAELLGGIGLVLPWALDIAPVLTPLSAVGLGIIMVLAAAFHARRGEKQGIVINIIMLALFVFIAIGRF